MNRYGMVLRLKPEKYEEYKQLHADVWPDVLKMIHDTRKLRWDTGESEEVSNFERPQLLFNESGEMTHMIGATARGQGLNKATETCGTIVPLKSS